MLTIPFLHAETRTRRAPAQPVDRVDVSKTIPQARKALAERAPSRALALVAPLMEDKDAVPEAHLITGRALAALGRYPEALRCLEEYLDEHPNSVEGLIAAGLAAAGARELARAIQLFNRAGQRLSAPARALVEPLGSLEHPDPVGLEEMVAEVESHPKDPDRLFAVACALGQAGHFRAVERFLRLLDKQIAESYV